ncbi:MAG: polyketide cyclase [Sphingobacteriales bacterium 50-39]|nr:SRPBCC domain-containing protein [Sphingobacteriales bacterium]OJW59826.1 MAG: polyketide cyclase [Sphingobacteriales bacterium 50-39]
MPSAKDNMADRELIFSRLLDAPIKLVWEIWTSPEHIKIWWGPDGFTNTIKKMDVQPNGEWNLTMHGPDGSDYEIKSVFREIVKYKKIVYEQFTAFKYVATIEFESRGEQTLLRWQMLFESKENLIDAAKTYGVDTGFKQNAQRLVDYLSQTIQPL